MAWDEALVGALRHGRCGKGQQLFGKATDMSECL